MSGSMSIVRPLIGLATRIVNKEFRNRDRATMQHSIDQGGSASSKIKTLPGAEDSSCFTACVYYMGVFGELIEVFSPFIRAH